MWVIATLIGLVALIVLALCIPLDAALSIDTSVRPRLRLSWLFGLISKEFGREKKKKLIKEKPKRKRGIAFRTTLKILRTKGLLRKITDLIRDVLSQFRIKQLAVNCRLGLDDPADTGLIFAIVGAATPLLHLPSRYQFTVQPSFAEEATFDGHVHGVVRLRPIKLAWPLLRFAFSLATFRVVKTLISSSLIKGGG